VYTHSSVGIRRLNGIYLKIYTILGRGMRTAKIFQNGQSQAVRIPKEFRLIGSEVYIKKQGDSIVLTPIGDNPWQQLFDSFQQFSDDFMPTRSQPTQQDREDLF
jgi:antitoxin VapB